jgi:cAMP-specific phosphodiesterase 4
MWRIILELILAKDMGLHFVVIRQLADLVESGEFNISGQSAHRLLLMKVLLKCADMAPVMRPLVDPGRWDVGLAEKFFRTGHLEEAKLVHSGQPPTYENLDKEESMMGFFCGVCLPLAAVLVKACSSLKAIPDILKGNIQKWAKATKRPVPQFAPPARKKT